LHAPQLLAFDAFVDDESERRAKRFA